MDGLTITRVSETKKGRMALFCGDEFLFSLDEETYHFYPVAEGQTLSAAELEKLRQLSDTRKAKEKALFYLGMREYGSTELYEKLRQKFDEHSSAAAVARMEELGLLNDEAFAAHRAQALKARKKSRREAARLLAEKGLDREVIQQALDEVYQEGDEEEALRALIERQYARKLSQGKRDAVWAALARRGFSARQIRAALEDWQSQNGGQEETDTGWDFP